MVNVAEKAEYFIERTYDTELVRSILSHPELFKRSGGIPVENYDPANQPNIIYLIPKLNDTVLGVTVLHIFNNPLCLQIHVNYLPEYWGQGLEVWSKSALDWAFDNLDINKIVAFAPDYYPEVKKHAEKCGMVSEGYLTNSVLSNGKLDNQHIMGVERCQQQQQ